MEDKQKVISTFLSKNTRADATIIRHILSDLRTAGYVSVRPRVGGASLNKPLSDITTLDIFKTVITPENCMYTKKWKKSTCRDLYEKMIVFMPN